MADLAASPSPTRTYKCQACGQQIVWGRRWDGAYVPLDPEPDLGGRFVLFDNGGAWELPIELLAFTTPEERGASDWGDHLHRDHRTTCGVGRGPRRISDSLARWARGDSRGSRSIGEVRVRDKPPWDAPIARPSVPCTQCGQQVQWGRSLAGPVALDIEPHRSGLLVFLSDNPDESEVASVGFSHDRTDRRPRYRNHHLSCRDLGHSPSR
jgi:endogenous inhibitor of DNA gyrase (YacG/DUF329 family)